MIREISVLKNNDPPPEEPDPPVIDPIHPTDLGDDEDEDEDE